MYSSKQLGFNFDHSYLDLPSDLYTLQKPVPVEQPELVIFNDELAAALGLDFSKLSDQATADILAGNALIEAGGYFSQAYAGHQFGHFTVLGDGRATMLGEHVTPDGQRFDLQFKGSGQTPYSRSGDGRAVLGPMLREYIVAEAMHSLGIPTARALSVVKTGQMVRRETLLPGAILVRVASSHLRIGTFEFAARQQDPKLLSSLLDYAIKRHYPDLINAENKALALLKVVMEQQINLIVNWMRVGFIHGVMNTDNMTISGETIDYGPCAFMDAFDPNTVFSSIDHAGRYAYQNQPVIAQWNLARLAETLLPLIDPDQNKAIALAEEAINLFPAWYEEKWLGMMRSKLGLFGKQQDDVELIGELLGWMQENKVDYINTFYALSRGEALAGAWYQRWQARVQKNSHSFDDLLKLMRKVNPAVIPRNHKVEQVLQAAYQDDFAPLHEFMRVLKNPYSDDVPDAYQAPPSPDERVYQTFCGT